MSTSGALVWCCNQLIGKMKLLGVSSALSKRLSLKSGSGPDFVCRGSNGEKKLLRPLNRERDHSQPGCGLSPAPYRPPVHITTSPALCVIIIQLRQNSRPKTVHPQRMRNERPSLGNCISPNEPREASSALFAEWKVNAESWQPGGIIEAAQKAPSKLLSSAGGRMPYRSDDAPVVWPLLAGRRRSRSSSVPLSYSRCHVCGNFRICTILQVIITSEIIWIKAKESANYNICKEPQTKVDISFTQQSIDAICWYELTSYCENQRST